MKEEQKARLGKVLANFDTQLTSAAETKQENVLRDEEFNREFLRVATEVVRPVFDVLAEQLNSAGHRASVQVHARGDADRNGRRDSAKIELRVVPKSHLKALLDPSSCPSVTFFASTAARKVGVHASVMMPDRGGSSGPRGDHALTDITEDFVSALVVETIEKAFVR